MFQHRSRRFSQCVFCWIFWTIATCGASISSNSDEHAASFYLQSTLAGALKRGASKLHLTPEKTKIISQNIAKVVEWDELMLLCVVGWLTVPVFQYQHNHRPWRPKRATNIQEQDFHDTTLHLVLDNLSQLAKLAFVIYMVDIAKIIVVGMGFGISGSSNSMNEIPHAFAKIGYTGWMANRLAAFKRYGLAKYTNQNPRDLEGQVQIVDRLIDAGIYGLALYVAVDTIQTGMGAATKSFLAFGSVSTLVVSLALQGFVAEVFHGLFLAGSNRINEGDSVEVLGMRGKIENLGWLESTLQKSDVSGDCISFGHVFYIKPALGRVRTQRRS